MTGRDVPTREKALSVFLSTIMVLSVVAIGAAGFAGSAAAASTSDTGGLADGEGYIFADPANSFEDSTQTIQVQADGNLGGANVDYINITYSEVDVQDLDNQTSASSGLGNDVSIDIAGTTVNDANVTTVGNSINISNIDDTDDNIGIAAGDVITLELGSNTGINTSDGYDVSVQIQDDAQDDTQQFTGLTLGVDEGPIEVDQSGTTIFFNTFDKAVANASNAGDTVTVTETLDETLPFASTADVQADDVIIEGSSSDVIINSTQDPVINPSGQDNLTVQDLDFDSKGNDNGPAISGTASNLTVADNQFTNITSNIAVDVDVDDNGGGDDTTSVIEDNQFTNVDEAIDLGASSLDDGDSVDVLNNNIASFTGAEGFNLVALASNADLTFSGNDIDGAGSGTTAINIAGTSENVTISDGTLNGTTGDGVNVGATGGDGITITGTVFTNISTNSIDLDTIAGGASEVDIEDISVDDGGGSGTGVLADDADADVTISGSSTINDTSVGVRATDANSLVVSSTDITNTNSDGIDINNPTGLGNGIVVNESTTIDNAGANGVLVDLGSISDSVDINNVEINGSANAGVNVDHSGSGSNLADDAVLNVTSSTITNNGGGLNVTNVGGSSDSGTDTQFNVHFNTIESNGAGIFVDTSNFDGLLNATFNDIVNNDANGLEVSAIDDPNGDVNANYSYWGDWNFLSINCTYSPQTAQLGYDQSPGVYEYTRIHTEERG
jgi:surface glycoprotein (TIGR04207 family)